jgi:putative ATP-dependent endonuclease of OLD family
VQIRRVKIKGFRGIRSLTWCPHPGLNCLIGPGDVGKSTVLQAISTVLSPAPGRVASEHDYFGGRVGEGFKLELLVGGLDDELLASWPTAPLWTWFDASQTVQAEPEANGEGVLCLRAQANEDLEIEHVVIDPSEGELPLSPSRRARFGLATVGGPGTAYRDLRLSRGSLLSRNVATDQLRGLATEALQAARTELAISAEVRARLQLISSTLSDLAPGTGPLDLGLLPPKGQNLLSMIGLFAERDDGSIPLTNAGLGTQQLALYALSRMLIDSPPIFVVDEIESGLEPFRQRDLIGRLRTEIDSAGQAFLTTHSPAVLGAMDVAELCRLDPPNRSGESTVRALPAALQTIRRKDPEALLCKLPAVMEGRTEIGVVGPIFEQEADLRGTTIGALGVHLVDGGGQPKVFELVAALKSSNTNLAVFLDEEHEYAGKRDALRRNAEVAFGTYTDARCLEEALSKQLSIDQLQALLSTPVNGRDLTTARLQQLSECLQQPGRRPLGDLLAEFGEERCRKAYAETANKASWFKGLEASEVVGEFLRDQAPDCQIVADVRTLWDRICASLGMPSSDDVVDESAA